MAKAGSHAASAGRSVEKSMQSASVYTPLKVVALVVLLLLLGAASFAGFMATTHWTGIAV